MGIKWVSPLHLFISSLVTLNQTRFTVMDSEKSPLLFMFVFHPVDVKDRMEKLKSLPLVLKRHLRFYKMVFASSALNLLSLNLDSENVLNIERSLTSPPLHPHLCCVIGSQLETRFPFHYLLTISWQRCRLYSSSQLSVAIKRLQMLQKIQLKNLFCSVIPSMCFFQEEN